VIAPVEDLEHVRAACRVLVRRRARAAAALSAVPIPGVDIAGDIALLLEVIPAINRRFGLDHAQIEKLDNTTKVVVYRLIRKVGTRFVGQTITAELIVGALSSISVQIAAESVLKFVPIAGTIASGLIAYQMFKRIAYAHIEDCVKVARSVFEEDRA
jgi:uncharacterized protein (DUF697 family)